MYRKAHCHTTHLKPADHSKKHIQIGIGLLEELIGGTLKVAEGLVKGIPVLICHHIREDAISCHVHQAAS